MFNHKKSIIIVSMVIFFLFAVLTGCLPQEQNAEAGQETAKEETTIEDNDAQLRHDAISSLMDQIQALQQRIETLELDIDVLEQEKTDLVQSENEAQETILQLERQIKKLDLDLRNLEILRKAPSLKPKPGWEQYFPTPTTTTLENKTLWEVKVLLGEPPFLIRSTAFNPQYSREVWVYVPYDEDSTGLYIYFKGGKVYKTVLDEFMGLIGSSILEDEGFWFS